MILRLMVLDASVEALREELRTLDLHDATNGVQWTHCSDKRNDPCGCVVGWFTLLIRHRAN